MVGAHLNKRGRWQCDYCTHTTWKSRVYAERHVTEKHEMDMLRQKAMNLEAELEVERHKPPATKIVEKEKIVYKNRLEPEYRQQSVSIYCPTCRMVQQNVRIPARQTIADTPHSYCNLTGLMIVTTIN